MRIAERTSPAPLCKGSCPPQRTEGLSPCAQRPVPTNQKSAVFTALFWRSISRNSLLYFKACGKRAHAGQLGRTVVGRGQAGKERELAGLDDALAAYNRMRATEGERLAADIGSRLDTIEHITGMVEERSPQTVAEYRARLTAKMEEVLQSTTIDEARILTEAAIFADKIAVDEETVRLRSHVSQLRTMLVSDEPMGRKMDFLIQEVNRESNTIGSKCCDVSIAQVVVALKAEVEKMREQVQNIE